MCSVGSFREIKVCQHNEISDCSLSTAYKLSNWPQKNQFNLMLLQIIQFLIKLRAAI